LFGGRDTARRTRALHGAQSELQYLQDLMCVGAIVKVQVLGALLALSVSGCVATGPLYVPPGPPPKGNGTLYVYSMLTYVDSALRASFYLDGQPLLELNTGGYAYCYVSAGSHELTQAWTVDSNREKQTYLRFTVTEGGAQYVRFDNRLGVMNGRGARIWEIQNVSADEAMPEIVQERYQPAKNCSK
jgi:Protein of unknown function (DUF2846)